MPTLADYEAELGELTPRFQAFEAAYPRTPRRNVLGSGSFGVVYAVCAKGNPRARCVAKEISVERLGQAKRSAVLLESELLKKLGHPHIVACLDTFLTGRSLYIIMEYATGGDLKRHILGRRDAGGSLFPESTVMTTFVQIVAAMHFVHSRKIIHRDIKPANLFVCGAGDLALCRVKLGDFGLGKLFEATTFEAYSTVGSPFYFSPELCKSKPYGRKSDIWSLGVVLHELTALDVPFKAKIVPAIAMMICRSEPAPLPEGVGPELRRLILWMLLKEPGPRPSADQLLKDAYVASFLPLVPEAQGLARAVPAGLAWPGSRPGGPASPAGGAARPADDGEVPAFIAAAFPGAKLTVSLRAGVSDGGSAPCLPEEDGTDACIPEEEGSVLLATMGPRPAWAQEEGEEPGDLAGSGEEAGRRRRSRSVSIEEPASPGLPSEGFAAMRRQHSKEEASPLRDPAQAQEAEEAGRERRVSLEEPPSPPPPSGEFATWRRQTSRDEASPLRGCKSGDEGRSVSMEEPASPVLPSEEFAAMRRQDSRDEASPLRDSARAQEAEAGEAGRAQSRGVFIEAAAAPPASWADRLKADVRAHAGADGRVSRGVLEEFLLLAAPSASWDDVEQALDAADVGQDVDFPAFVEWLRP